MTRRDRVAPWLVIGALLAGRSAAAQDLRIAAASDLQVVLPAITTAFERDSGHTASLTFGSSGNFVTQIENGAPFDLFLSADIDYPRRLVEARLADPATLYEYARGRLILWTRRDSGIDLHRGVPVLVDARVRHIAIANPAHAPYGQAAVAALRHDGVLEQVQHKFILGENIAQAAQFAQSGSAEVGLLALALAMTPALKDSGAYVEVPSDAYPPIRQAVVMLTRARDRPLALRFIDALKQPASRRLLRAHGFAVAED
jgi:molybdate transport system substrate-binding protein